MVHVPQGTTVYKELKHRLAVPLGPSATPLELALQMNVLIAPLVSTAKATITRSLLGPVRLGTIAPRDLEPMCPGPMVICALKHINVPRELPIRRSVNQVCRHVGTIGHFRVALNLFMKARLSAKFLL